MKSLVMIPGMMCDDRLFAAQRQTFENQLSISIADISGHATIEELACDILDKSPPKFALLGLSMGGIVAMEMIRQQPSRIERLALLDTNHLAEKDDIKQRRIPQIVAVKKGKLAEVMRDEMKPNYLTENANKKDILDLCMDMALGLGSKVFISQSQALMTRPEQTNTLKNISVPTLILCGKEDALCPPKRHELMHEIISSSELVIIDNAGHLPVLEQPELTNQHIKNWLDL